MKYHSPLPESTPLTHSCFLWSNVALQPSELCRPALDTHNIHLMLLDSKN